VERHAESRDATWRAAGGGRERGGREERRKTHLHHLSQRASKCVCVSVIGATTQPRDAEVAPSTRQRMIPPTYVHGSAASVCEQKGGREKGKKKRGEEDEVGQRTAMSGRRIISFCKKSNALRRAFPRTCAQHRDVRWVGRRGEDNRGHCKTNATLWSERSKHRVTSCGSTPTHAALRFLLTIARHPRTW
jgi:hypothetical protein